MPKLAKVKMEKTDDGKVIYTYKKSDEHGHQKTVKVVYEPSSSDRLVFALDLIQRMKDEAGETYKNNTLFWKAYTARSLKERPDSVPYKYTHFVKLTKFKYPESVSSSD